MRYPFSNEAEFNFNDEWDLPRGIYFTDIDGMLRGKRVMVAVELKHIKQLNDSLLVPASQYYTYKFLARAGIGAFYLFKQGDGSMLAYYVDALAEPKRVTNDNGTFVTLPVSRMGRHSSLAAVKDLLVGLIHAGDLNDRGEVFNIIKQIRGGN